jgi:hypothetical protein
MADEHVFLSEDNLYISNTKVILLGTTYATANLTSVQKRFTPASKGCATLLVVIGALMTLVSLGTVFSKDAGTGIMMLLIFGGIFAAGLAWLRSLKPTYHVVLASSSGEREGMSSKDGALVDRVIQAITDAITHRG